MHFLLTCNIQLWKVPSPNICQQHTYLGITSTLLPNLFPSHFLVDLDSQLSKVLLGPLNSNLLACYPSSLVKSTYHVVIGFPCLVKAKHLLIHHRVDIIGLDGSDHIPHESFATNINTTHSADVTQCLQNSRLCLRVHASKEPNNTDDTLELHALETLLERSATTHLDNVVYTCSVRSQLASSLTPVGLSLVIDNVIGTELLELLSLLCRRGCRNNCRASSFGEL